MEALFLMLRSISILSALGGAILGFVTGGFDRALTFGVIGWFLSPLVKILLIAAFEGNLKEFRPTAPLKEYLPAVKIGLIALGIILLLSLPALL